MEINSGSVNLTTLESSLIMCSGGEAALAALIVSALVTAQLASLTQEYMKLLMNQRKLRGDNHTSCPSELVDAENDDDNEDEGEEEEEGDEGDGTPVDGNKSGAKDVPGGDVEENGNDEDEEGEEPNEDDDDDDDDDDEDDEEDDGGEENDEEEEEDEDEEEEEEEDEEEEALHPPKKRKK